MALVSWHKLYGQQRVKETLAGAFESGQIGHAYLFSGDAGTGKFQAALEFGMALLCENTEKVPCFKCQSCLKMLAHEHSDFHMAMPVHLPVSHNKLTDEDWLLLHTECCKRISNSYDLSKRDSSEAIPVEWIREITHQILRGSVLSGKNVTIIADIDTMNSSSANAMLKTLEEPPRDTVMVLTTSRPHNVLPTIVSRCQTIRFSRLTEKEISEALAGQNGLSADDSRIIASAAGADGSLGRAMMLMKIPVDEMMAQAASFCDILAGGDRLAVIAELDRITGKTSEDFKEETSTEHMLTYILSYLRERLLAYAGVPEKYINEKNSKNNLPPIGPEKAGILEKTCRMAVSAIHSHGNPQLALSAWALSMMEILNEQEQPSR
jgi:DNA polymerase III delta' subunit